MQFYLLDDDLNSSGDIPRSGICRSFIFSFLKPLQTDFHSENPALIYIPTNSLWGFCASLSAFVIIFLIIAILTGMRWNLNVILICISLMTKDVEHFFMYLLASWTYPIENCQFIAHLFQRTARLFWSLFSNVWVLYIFWIVIPCQMNSWQIFSPILKAVYYYNSVDY
jgi:hypothetical protein